MLEMLRSWPPGKPVPAFCVRQPWAGAIVWLEKDVDNRKHWPFNYRGPVLIVASAAKPASDDVNALIEMMDRFDDLDDLDTLIVDSLKAGEIPYELMPLGAIAAVAELWDVVRPGDEIPADHEVLSSPWTEEGRIWVCLRNVTALDPVSYKGQQGLFDIPYDVAARLEQDRFMSAQDKNDPTGSAVRPSLRTSGRTFMLTWNPDQGRPSDLRYAVVAAGQGCLCEAAWSTGNRKDVPIGSRVFLMRQGVEPRGIVASGYTQSEPEPNDNPNDHSRYCELVWTAVLDSERNQILKLADLRKNQLLKGVPWGIQRGGREFSHEEANELERIWSDLLVQLRKTEVPLG